MSTKFTDFTKDDIQNILGRSATDTAFRQLCLSDSSAAVEEATGKQVPVSFELQFVDNSGADLILVLPHVSIAPVLDIDLVLKLPQFFGEKPTDFNKDDILAVLEKSATDTAFRQICLSDSSAAVEEATG